MRNSSFKSIKKCLKEIMMVKTLNIDSEGNIEKIIAEVVSYLENEDVVVALRKKTRIKRRIWRSLHAKKIIALMKEYLKRENMGDMEIYVYRHSRYKTYFSRRPFEEIEKELKLNIPSYHIIQIKNGYISHEFRKIR